MRTKCRVCQVSRAHDDGMCRKCSYAAAFSAGTTERACYACGEPMQSTHVGHRHCNACRGKLADELNPLGDMLGRTS